MTAALGPEVGARQDEGVAKTFLVARNPEPDSTLPYLIRLPLGGGQLVLKARETWPRTAAVVLPSR